MAVIIFIMICVQFVMVAFRQPDIPVSEIHQARIALSEAGKAEAEKYAVKDYKFTLALWDSLMTEWSEQNQLFYWKRNFTHLKNLAEKVFIHADLATECAKNVKCDIQTATEIDMDLLDSLIMKFDQKYYNLPLDSIIHSNMTQAKMLYAEGVIAFERKEYHKASELITECRKLAEHSEDYIKEFLSIYFNNYPQWEKWISETIQWSKKTQNVAIVVDKISHKCIVYNKGKLAHEFVVDFGSNWIGYKSHSGDKATPEGKYFITKKIGSNQTKYFKALLINYPNEDDKKRFRNAVKEGAIPDGRGIGNLIEIHGEGGRGVNWTDGCVALENNEMDQLFRTVVKGTPVTIIGSTKPLNELYSMD